MKLKDLEKFDFQKYEDKDLDIVMYELELKNLTFLCHSNHSKYGNWTGDWEKDKERDVVVSIYESSEEVTFTNTQDLSVVLHIFGKSERVMEVV